MDDVTVLTETLNSTIARHGRAVQNYEIEIANMTAQIVRLQAQLEDATKETKEPTKPTAVK
jgi:peptidoglycan hydrolase CwlO-like protein